LAQLAQLVRRVLPQQLQAQRVRKEQLVQQVLRVRKVLWDQLVHKAKLALLATQAHKVYKDKDLIFEVHTLQDQLTMSTL
jgi:hypothetical protein